YTEDFARGTQRDTYCDLHQPQGIFGRIAGFFGAGAAPLPPKHLNDAVLPPSPASGSVASGGPPESISLPAARAEEPKKKRGFWARLFGVGKDNKDKDQRVANEPAKKKGG